MNEFERRKQTPQYWCNKSSDLRASAGAVWYCIKRDGAADVVEELGLGANFKMEVATFPVFLMLCGLSLELMYKAICVAKSVKFPNNHNLKELCKLAEVPATDEDLTFLDLFTASVYWEGKYPVPKYETDLEKLNELRSMVFLKDVHGSRFKCYNNNLNWDLFNTLWSNSCKLFYDLKT